MIKLLILPAFKFLLVALILTSCASEQESKSIDIIPQEKFTEILVECQLAESQLTVTRVLQPVYKDSILNYYAGIFETYNITSEEFSKSLKHYTEDPANMDSIYSDMLLILQAKSDDLGTIELPKNNLGAISRTQLGDILYQTPFADSILLDTIYNTTHIRESLMIYIDSNFHLIDAAKTNRSSFEFSFVINSSNKIMYNQLKDYLATLKNK